MSMKDWKFIVKSPDDIRERGLMAWYTIVTGDVDLYTGKTVADYRNEGYHILSEADFDTLVKQYERSICGDWKEISAEEYDSALNVLPPLKWYNGGFFCSEMLTGSISDFYQQIGNKFFVSLQDVYTPRREILNGLNSYIKEMNIKV